MFGNIIANLFGRIFGAAAVLLTAPTLAQLLGAESYGLVGFYATFTSVLALVDIGLSATLSRELASLTAFKERSRARREAISTFELCYYALAVVACITVWVAAPAIAHRFLSADGLSPARLTYCIRLMAVAAAFQLPATLFINGLMALERQIAANSIQLGWNLTRTFGAVALARFVDSSVETYLTLQIVCGVAFLLSSRIALMTWVKHQHDASLFSVSLIKRTWHYSVSMAAIGALSIAVSQMDRLFISASLRLEDIGIYALATTLATIPVMIASPIAASCGPRLIRLFSMGDQLNLIKEYHSGASLVGAVALPVAIVLWGFAEDAVLAWTSTPATVAIIAPLVRLLCIAQLLQAIALLPFQLAIARGDIAIFRGTSIRAILVITILLAYCVPRYGLAGAALSWLSCCAFIFVRNLILLHRRIPEAGLIRYAAGDVGQYAIIACMIVALLRLQFEAATDRQSAVLNLFVALSCAFLACIGSYFWTWRKRTKVATI